MPRTSGSKELDSTQKGLALGLLENPDSSNHGVAKRLNCDEKTIRNLRHRVEDKENIGPNDDLISNQPRSGRPLKLSEHDVRRLINHATKN